MNAPIHREIPPSALLDTGRALAAVSAQWDNDIVGQLTRYITIPAKSPGFDPDWVAHGHIETVVREAADWVLAQKPHAIFTSDYVNKVLDFNRTVVARSGNGWLVRNSGDLRQLRLPISAGYPDLAASRGVIGFSDHNDQRYIHLAPGGEAVLKMTTVPPQYPWLAAATAGVDRFERTATGIKLLVTARSDGYLRFGGAAGCRLMSGGKTLAVGQQDGMVSVTIIPGSYGMELVCK